MEQAFYGCTNLQMSATDVPDLSQVTSMAQMFQGATNFTGDVSKWNVNSITAMNGLFQGASKFNADIVDWDVRNVTNMQNMFNSASSFNQDLHDWCVTKITSAPSGFATSSPIAGTAKIPTWGKCLKGDFVTTRRTTSANETVIIYGAGAGYSYTIDR
jgi:surface protein